MKNIYHLLEVANVHGGDMEYILDLIDEFEDLRGNFGIKFQPFKYDLIATKEFEWYPVYKELFFNIDQWSEIIKKASKYKEVWIDTFDLYSVEIIKENINIIKGIKLQSSILYNLSVINELARVNLSSVNLILNIAAQTLNSIEEILESIKKTLNVKSIFLQVGFQGYPTELSDSGLSKITEIRNNFENEISFADHISREDVNAIWLPVFAAIKGASLIEKHIMHSTRESKYDFFSSLKLNEYQKLIKNIDSYLGLTDQPFINKKEAEYLEKSIQIPVLNKEIEQKELISIAHDLDYKRSDKIGINTKNLLSLINDFNILTSDKKKNETLKSEDFKKACIATIIACRLKSSRLAKKALLKIGDLTSIELCIKNALKFKNVNHTILATSTLEEDDELRHYTFNQSVVFHRGDPIDVVQRYLDIIDKLGIDVFIRITGDMPYVSNDLLEILLASHFKTGAHYTTAKRAAVGTNLEIINSKALKKVKKHFPSADYSEYMTWYFQNNPEHFNLNFVDLPDKWIKDYRLTLDYQEDLDMFNLIEQHFQKLGKGYSIDELFNFLDSNPEVAEINAHLTLKYQADKNLIDLLNKKTRINK